MSSVITCNGLRKTFSEGVLQTDVLLGIDLDIDAGERLAIIGASGAGKSTLLHLMGGLDEPSAGSVSVDGQDMSTLDDASRGKVRNEKLGFVYQFHHLLDDFSALENVCMPLLIRGTSVDEAVKSATEMLARVDLSTRVEHRPGELSGGERQRVAVARALVTRPKCVLADEPTGNLDHKTASKVFDLILEINAELNTSLMIVTHDHTLARKMNRAVLLEDGVLKEAQL